MKAQNTFSMVVFVLALAGGFILYTLSETTQAPAPPAFAAHHEEVAEMKRQIAALKAKVDWLAEHFTEPQREKPTP